MFFLVVGFTIGAPFLVAYMGWMCFRYLRSDLQTGYYRRPMPSGMSRAEFARRIVWLSLKFVGLVVLIVWGTTELGQNIYSKSEKAIPKREMNQLYEASGISSFQRTEGKRQIMVIRLFADTGIRLMDARTVLYDYAQLPDKHSLKEIEGKKVKIWYANGPRIADGDYDKIVYHLEVDGALWLDLAQANYATDLWFDRAYVKWNKWKTPLKISMFIFFCMSGITIGYLSFRKGYEKILGEGTANNTKL